MVDECADTVTQAFQAGWITLPDYDARLAHLAQCTEIEQARSCVADLRSGTHQRLNVVNPTPPRPNWIARIGWVPAILMAAATVINIFIWAVICLGLGELIYFWPVWLFIPLGILAGGGYALQELTTTREAKLYRRHQRALRRSQRELGR